MECTITKSFVNAALFMILGSCVNEKGIDSSQNRVSEIQTEFYSFDGSTEYKMRYYQIDDLSEINSVRDSISVISYYDRIECIDVVSGKKSLDVDTILNVFSDQFSNLDSVKIQHNKLTSSESYAVGVFVYSTPKIDDESRSKQVEDFRNKSINTLFTSNYFISIDSVDNSGHVLDTISSLFKFDELGLFIEDSTDRIVMNQNALTIFERHPEWVSAHVVCDLTASVLNSFGEILKWISKTQNSEDIYTFTFFNDGNSRPDAEKYIGQTGGVYHIRTKNIFKIYKTAMDCVNNGNGGDFPENDIESILKGIDEYGSKDEIVLIADNYSSIRDFELVDSIHVPVRIVLCNVQSYINPQYLGLAFETGGSIHTIEDDLYDLKEIPESIPVKIGQYYYIRQASKFKALTLK